MITKIRDAKGHEKVYRAEKNSLDIPVIVLINAYSASASELFASALRDNGRAVLVGEKTYGKGIVQTYFQLPGDDGVFKLTTEAYYTPADVCIHESGLEPDVSVSLSADAVEDLQLEAALELFEKQ